MRRIVKNIFRFLPIQLLFLHFRKYQLLLVFWLVLFSTVSRHFASAFGASSLFIAPEYQGKVSFFSLFIIGGAMAVFIMAWHITTFIIHSHRIPYLGATRHAFIKYCINNSLVPVIFLSWYNVFMVKHLLLHEQMDIASVFRLIIGFYLGLTLLILISFAYFFRVDRDLLKVVLSRIANPSRIKNIIPYDTLDYDADILRADTYLSGRLQILKCADLESYTPRLLHTVLRKHHRNAITAIVFAILLLWLSGFFIDDPKMRLPAAAGFLLLFAVTLSVVGAIKYFLRSWEVLGWMIIIGFLSLGIKYHVFDVRSIAYGIDYKSQAPLPIYNTQHIDSVFTNALYKQDKNKEEQRLNKWDAKLRAKNDTTSPLIVVAVSGGGTRAAFWSFRVLQYMDSLSKGKLYNNVVMVTGASGGMIGASYWREIHDAYLNKKINTPYKKEYQDNVAKDLLNAIIFSLASIDFISPFNKIAIAGRSYKKDRGYAMEQELIRNTNGLLDHKLEDYTEKEQNAKMPLIIINSTIINDGRRLMIASSPLGYLTKPEPLNDSNTPTVDAIDFTTFFKDQNPYNLRLTTALRMNATFPYVLPVVRMPSEPGMNIMDAGLRDNFGIEVSLRYLHSVSRWAEQHKRKMILLQIRDTRENETLNQSEMNTLASMVSNPLFAIQSKWEKFQSYGQLYTKEYAADLYKDNLCFVKLEYIPKEKTKSAALNFHITGKDKEDVLQSVYNTKNQNAMNELLRCLMTNQ